MPEGAMVESKAACRQDTLKLMPLGAWRYGGAHRPSAYSLSCHHAAYWIPQGTHLSRRDQPKALGSSGCTPFRLASPFPGLSLAAALRQSTSAKPSSHRATRHSLHWAQALMALESAAMPTKSEVSHLRQHKIGRIRAHLCFATHEPQ